MTGGSRDLQEPLPFLYVCIYITSPLASKESHLIYYITVLKCFSTLRAVGVLWLKLDIDSKELKQDTKLLAVFRLTATNLPHGVCPPAQPRMD